MKIAVGQQLWFVPASRYSDPRYVTVTKVGRKWATLDGKYRMDLNTLQLARNGYRTGTLHLSREQWEAKNAADEAWNELHMVTRRAFYAPAGLTADAIRQAIAILTLASPGGAS